MRHFLPHFIEEKFRAGESQGSFEAAAMFVDLSGFTALTEKLMEHGVQGAEELSQALNLIFQPTVALVYRQGGFIPYFAGDSFTGIFSLNSENAAATAQKVLRTARQSLDRFLGEQGLEGLPEEWKIGIKIGLAVGTVEWGIVGERRKAFYFRGTAIDQCSTAQTKAGKLEMVCDLSFLNLVKNSLNFSTEPVPGDFFKILPVRPGHPGGNVNFEEKPLAVEISKKEKPKRDFDILPPPNPEILPKFLPVEVTEQGGFGEFRNVVSIFISFDEVKTHAELDRFATVILDQSLNFSGYLKEIDFGDKGGVMLCLFGAPVSFENNIERALEFVAAVQDELREVTSNSKIKYRIGITSGVAFTGIIGSEERCQYAAVGARVNFAARLMSSAKWSEIIVDDNVQKNRNFKFNFRGDLKYKGFQHPLPTYVLTGRNVAGESNFSGEYVGREADMQKLMDFAQPFREGRFPGIAYVFGEAGIGKSRFCYEFRRQLRETFAVTWFHCQSDQILRKPFNPFIYFLKNYFDQSPENSETKNREVFEDNFLELMVDISRNGHAEAENLRKEIARTQSVLAALVGLNYPGSLWEQLDARARYQNAFDALTALFLAESLLQPVALQLEDGHWYDEMSREFLAQFVRRAKNYPIFLLVTSRYDDDGAKSFVLRKNLMAELDIWGLELDLNFLQPADLEAFAEAKLGGKLHPDLVELLQRMTQGNPFYLEQMAEYFKESDLLDRENGVLRLKTNAIQISDSVKQIMMARIDRLSGMVKETVKAAAVIGREFELPVLSEVMAGQEEFARRNGDLDLVLKEQIDDAEKWQIWHAMNELRYIFRHSLLREAAYDMQLRARLRDLHLSIAKAIRKLYPKNEERFVDLAFHFEQAEDEKQTNKYLEKAAKYSQRNFQNRQAIGFYDKILKNYSDKKKKEEKIIRILLRKGQVHELIGEWDKGEEAYNEALGEAKKLNDWKFIGRSNRRLGNLMMLRGNYPEAQKHLDHAITCFELIDDRDGLAKSYGHLGTLFFRQGNYESAKSWFTKAIEINRSLDRAAENAPMVANMGLIFMNQGNYDAGIAWLEEQLDLSEQAKDKPGQNILYTNLGIIYLEKGALDSSQLCLEKGLALSEELGNKLFMTICIGSLGSVWEKKGDYPKAMQLFERDLSLVRELGDKQGTAIACGLIGDLLSVMGEFDRAIENLEKALALSRELNYKKGIAKALNTLGDTYFFKNDTERAAKYYSEAIETSREMGNRLVLCSSLIEKGLVVLYAGDVAAARRFLEEGRSIAISLGNHDLQFSANILQAKIAMAEHNPDGARHLLYQIIALSKSGREEAAAHYELRKVGSDPENHRERALSLYRDLFEKTPQYLFRMRVAELENGILVDGAAALH